MSDEEVRRWSWPQTSKPSGNSSLPTLPPQKMGCFSIATTTTTTTTPSRATLIASSNWRQTPQSSSENVPKRERSASAPQLQTPSKSTTPPINAQSRATLSTCWRSQTAFPAPPLIPTFSDIHIGEVYRLSKPDQDSIIHHQIGFTAQEPWNHPVVILNKISSGPVPMVDIAICTSFDDRHVSDVRMTHDHEQYMLASNMENEVPHGNTYLAEVASRRKFAIRTYVGLKQRFRVEVRFLEGFGKVGSEIIRFDRKAMERIVEEKPCAVV